MPFAYLPFRAPLSAYEQQAERLLAGHRAADPAAIDLLHKNHPRFLDDKIVWLPRRLSATEIAAADLSLDDARLAIARWHDFLDWPALASYVDAISNEGDILDFETAAEAVVDGDAATLRSLLDRNPGLVRTRSTRICRFDPPMHRATLLHYTGANGVEQARQRTPANAVEVAQMLLQAGAEPDALADLYGTPTTTMSMLASSDHPAKAGVQLALMKVLLQAGADADWQGVDLTDRPLFTALAYGMRDAAALLVKHGARIDLPTAAALGRTDDVMRLLPNADEELRQRALSFAASYGYEDIVCALLDAGADPGRHNPKGNHPHTTPLHQAVLGGHEPVVRLMVARGARLDVRDSIYQGTPLGWAIHAGGARSDEMAACLRELGAVEQVVD